jgi:hypothetical protein
MKASKSHRNNSNAFTYAVHDADSVIYCDSFAMGATIASVCMVLTTDSVKNPSNYSHAIPRDRQTSYRMLLFSSKYREQAGNNLPMT